jgi:hypothetical protein
MHTREHAPGAYANGTRVRKSDSEPGDATPTGTLGTVLGSVAHPDRGIGYFVEWDSAPKCAVLVIAWKLDMAISGD